MKLGVAYHNCLFPVATLLFVASMFGGSAAADDQLPKGHFTLTGVEVWAIDRVEVDGKTHFRRSDTLKHWIRFDVRAAYTVAEDSKKESFKIVNRTISDKCKLTVDKAITFNGEKVTAGKNLLKFNEPGKARRIAMPSLNPLAIGSIYIRDEFNFPSDVYTFTFEWETKTGTTITDQVTVVIDLETAEEAKEAAKEKEARMEKGTPKKR